MSATEGKEILDKVKYLDGEKQAEVLRELRKLLLPPAASLPGAEAGCGGKPLAKNGFACPRCNRPAVIRNGVYRPKNAYGIFTQRFLCKECRTTFTDQPSRIIMKKVDLENLEKFFYLMLDGVCLRQIARTLRIPHGRSFLLQYSILSALQKVEIPTPLQK